MEIAPVPEESIGGLDDESCSSLSTLDDLLQKMDSQPSPEVKRKKVIFWRNLMFGCLIGTALVLAVFSVVCFSIWEDSDVLPGIFAGVIVLAFCKLSVLFYCYDQKIQQLGGLHFDASTPSTADLLGLNDKPAIHYAMGTSEAGSVSGRDSEHSGSKKAVKKVKSLLESNFNPFRGLNKQRQASLTNNNNMTGMASTESINQFLGAVKRAGTLMSDDNNSGNIYQSQPSAEFFAKTTVLFADISGFTAWSSVREPSQVFTLLETLFHAYDSIAHRRKVFKVETVGDCYVAVTGLPEPTKEHAVIMAYFARDCMRKMNVLCKKMETSLGPDTSDLKLRIGIHSGAVTGGVLRGKRSRFQLFGDTVNTASRMEATGEGGKIHLSDSTAMLLENAGKSHWMTKREQPVVAKGKGALQTYFLNVHSVDDHLQGTSAISSGDDDDESVASDDDNMVPPIANLNISPESTEGQGIIDDVTAASKALGNKISSAKVERFVSWNVDLLHRLLKQVVARRQILIQNNPTRKKDADESIYETREDTLLEEVKESIEMPSGNYTKDAIERAKTIQLDPVAVQQLHDYVRTVSDMYTNHPFHNFEHASHVTMSVAKLLSRIVAPSANEFTGSDETLHDHTYGITSDPLTQFACVLSALIHDADHPGVPNAQLVKEETKDAEKYKGKSVAEQNSFDRCWDLLMEPKYDELRRIIYTTSNGLARFRSLLVNSVLATDICDKDLKNLRNARWDRAFNKDGSAPAQPESLKAANDRKATIVIEHLIQASDVSHTMQHWHIFRRWNEKLFRECYKAYKEGRAEKDPAEFWYKGEIGFYDFYIIPLAKKLKECGVFGVSSSEYLDYAMSNRKEWEEKGEQVVQEMIANVKMIERNAIKKHNLAKSSKEKEKAPRNDDSVAGSSFVLSLNSSTASLGDLDAFDEDSC